MSAVIKATVAVATEVEVDRTRIKCVYSGTAGKCMCGCAGTYFYAPEHRRQAGKDRGYTIRDEEVSEEMVSKVFTILTKAPSAKLEHGLTGEPILSVQIRNRIYVAYFLGLDAVRAGGERLIGDKREV